MPRYSRYWLLVFPLLAISCKKSEGEARIAMARYIANPIRCSVDSDCCVVTDGCVGKAYVVAAKDSRKVASIIASTKHETCAKCAPPMVQASCGPDRVCVGHEVPHACVRSEPRSAGRCGKLDLDPTCAASALNRRPVTDRVFSRCGG
jgi:hypothetical protein